MTANELDKLESWAGKSTILMDASLVNHDLLEGEMAA